MVRAGSYTSKLLKHKAPETWHTKIAFIRYSTELNPFYNKNKKQATIPAVIFQVFVIRFE